MTFKEGLLKARGQITFITALAISTVVIVYLEALDTEDRIQSRLATELTRQRSNGIAVSPSLQAAVTSALGRSQEAYMQNPGTAAARAAMLTSLSSAVQLSIVRMDEGLAQVRKVLDDIEQRPGEQSAVLASALAVTAATFPSTQDRIGSLLSSPR